MVIIATASPRMGLVERKRELKTSALIILCEFSDANNEIARAVAPQSDLGSSSYTAFSSLPPLRLRILQSPFQRLYGI